MVVERDVHSVTGGYMMLTTRAQPSPNYSLLGRFSLSQQYSGAVKGWGHLLGAGSRRLKSYLISAGAQLQFEFRFNGLITNYQSIASLIYSRPSNHFCSADHRRLAYFFSLLLFERSALNLSSDSTSSLVTPLLDALYFLTYLVTSFW